MNLYELRDYESPQLMSGVRKETRV
jgi:hypothetical protein